MFIIIIFWLGRDWLSWFVFFVICFFLTSLFLITCFVCFFTLFCSHMHARVFGKTLVDEFPISYRHTECYLLFSWNDMIEMVEESPVEN